LIVPSDPGPSFDAARNWARYGRDAGGPFPGVIGVMPHHVGIVLGRCDDGSDAQRQPQPDGRRRLLCDAPLHRVPFGAARRGELAMELG
jgi:hypothetical protein